MKKSNFLLVLSILALLMGLKLIEISKDWAQITMALIPVVAAIFLFYMFDQRKAVERLERYKHDNWERPE
jgi:hypothetical protein